MKYEDIIQPQAVQHQEQSLQTRLCFPAVYAQFPEDASGEPDFPYLSAFGSNGVDVGACDLAGLPSGPAEALGHLVPMLLCGEESAVLVFNRASRRHTSAAHQAARSLLGRIAGEEAEHSRLLGHLMGRLPVPDDLFDRLGATRRFFMQLRSRDAATHFARIAVLDSCVCQILSALLFQSAELRKNPVVSGIFARIRADESKHVRFSRRYVLDAGWSERDLAGESATVRESLAVLLIPVAAWFDRLHVDPDRLFKRIRRA